MLDLSALGWSIPRPFPAYLLYLLIPYVGLRSLSTLPLVTSAKVHMLLS